MERKDSILLISRILLSLFVFTLIVLVLFPVVAQLLEKRGQPELQARILNRNFTRIQLNKGQVLLVPKPHMSLMRGMGNDNNWFDGPVRLPVGARFRASDHHWGATYTIEEIQPDGVKIHFDASGDSTIGEVRTSSGSIKLRWK